MILTTQEPEKKVSTVLPETNLVVVIYIKHVTIVKIGLTGHHYCQEQC